jgi:hypothetical protein
MQRAVEIFALIHLLPLGVSHILKRKVWAEFFISLSEKGRSGVLFHSFLSLWFGSIIAGFHSVWKGPALVLTLWGWLLLVKACQGFLFPDAALRSLQRVSLDGAWKFIPAGIVYFVVAGFTAYSLWQLPS